MKVKLLKEMNIHTKGGYSLHFSKKEEVELKRTADDDMVILDAEGNKVSVNDEEIAQEVLNNSQVVKESKRGRARLPIKALCESMDPELVADFMAATDQVPNDDAEEKAEKTAQATSGGLSALEIEVPVTAISAMSDEEKLEVLQEEDEFDFEDGTGELEADELEVIEEDDEDESTPPALSDEELAAIMAEEGIDPADMSDEEFIDVEVDEDQMREEVELLIGDEGEVTIKPEGDSVTPEGEVVEPVITEEDELEDFASEDDIEIVMGDEELIEEDADSQFDSEEELDNLQDKTVANVSDMDKDAQE